MYSTLCGQSGTADMFFPLDISRSSGNIGYFVPPDISRSDPAGTSDIFVPPDMSRSGRYNLSAGYIQTRNLYFPPFRLSSCHVRPISSMRQILGFPPDTSRPIFFPITIVPRQIFSRQIRLALRRRTQIRARAPFPYRSAPLYLGSQHTPTMT